MFLRMCKSVCVFLCMCVWVCLLRIAHMHARSCVPSRMHVGTKQPADSSGPTRTIPMVRARPPFSKTRPARPFARRLAAPLQARNVLLKSNPFDPRGFTAKVRALGRFRWVW